jgi:MtN3 and saliva related transmembrane protein
MNSEYIEVVGFIAAILTTTAFLPQALHSWKTRDLSGISFNMYVTFTIGVTLWLIYGFLIKSLPIIAANVITLPTTLVILFLKVKDIRSKLVNYDQPSKTDE